MPWTATQVIDRSLPRPQQAPTCGCSGPPVLQRSPSFLLNLFKFFTFIYIFDISGHSLKLHILISEIEILFLNVSNVIFSI